MMTHAKIWILSVTASLALGCGDDADAPADDLGSTGASQDSTGGVEPGTTSEGEESSSSSSTDAQDASSEESSSSGAPAAEVTPWTWNLPSGFPMPEVPGDNPMTVEGVELGRHLFYDVRLSADESTSCGTCHEPALAFTDGRGQAEGLDGAIHPRGSMSLANVAYASTLAWGEPDLLDLETHALAPIFGTEPIVEMGLEDEAELVARLEAEPRYAELFAAAYPDDAMPISLENTTKALASFQRTLISGNAPFDRWFFDGDESAVSDSVKRGWDLFNFPGECTYCHFSFNFTDATYFVDVGPRPVEFHNTGLYNVDGEGSYPEGNEGLFNVTGKPEDMGKFKSPTLRNIAVTAPYMHDGSIETLEEVIEHYGAGGRADTPHADFQMTQFNLKPDEMADLVAFMEALTDESFLSNPDFTNPWAEAE